MTKFDTGTELPENFLITDEFKDLFEIIENNKKQFLFVTGKAGTGKSTFLEYFRQNTSTNHIILAPTGVAAIKCKGKTIHSFFGFPHRVVEDKDIKKIKDVELIKKLDVLLVDECSMVRADILDAINKSLQFNRKNQIPFGGVQIVLIGDLFQLPPVISEARDILEELYPEGQFFFNSNIFYNTKFEIFEFSKIFRQSEKKFVNLLNKIRICEIENNELNEINRRVISNEDIYPENTIILCPTNAKVDEINEENLNNLDAKSYEYVGKISGSFKDKELPAEKYLRLKVGAQVMILKNDLENPRRWVNGTIAKVHHLEKDMILLDIDGKIYEIKKNKWEKFDYHLVGKSINPTVVGRYFQYPLKLAWSATIHKCQGQTFNKVFIDLDRGAFSHGQTYVALSRATSMDGIYLKRNIQLSDIIFDQRVYNYLGLKIKNKYLKEIKNNSKFNRRKLGVNDKKELENDWTEKDDATLIKLYKKNVPEFALAKIVKKKPTEVRQRILYLLNKEK